MRILIDIGHPAHVHYFRNFITIMRQKGHDFIITARDKEVTFDLLDYYKIPYISRGSGGKKFIGKLIYLLKGDFRVWKAAKKNNVDVFLSFGSSYAAHVSKLFCKPHIAFDDTEHAKFEHMMYVPFTNIIYTSSFFKKNFGKKHIKFNSMIELSYLMPAYFKPDENVWDLLKIRKDEKYAIFRFISWGANHDKNQSGIPDNIKYSAVKLISQYAKVFISAEGKLPDELESYRLKIPPYRIHDVLHKARLFFGESGTMSTESAILGTPTVRVSTLANSLGNFNKLQNEYGLLYFYSDAYLGLNKAVELISDENSKSNWMEKSIQFIKEKEDVNQIMVNACLGYKKNN